MNLIIVSVFLLLSSPLEATVENVYYWKSVNFENLPLSDDTHIGKYKYNIPENIDVIGLDLHSRSGLMFVGLGRLRPGIPSTLNAFCVSDYETGTSPNLWGFPNYEMNTLKASFYGETERKLVKRYAAYSSGYFRHFFTNNRHEVYYGGVREQADRPYNSLNDFNIISVVHPVVDEQCNRLYAVDSGVLQYSTTEIYEVQYPALIVFQLPSYGCKTRQFSVIRRVDIPKHLWTTAAGFNYITIDHENNKGSCDNVFVYITNSFDSSIVVYDYKKGSFSSVTDPSMKPIMAESNLIFHGNSMDFNYQLPLGIENIALGWPDKYGHRNAYFAPGVSQAQYAVSTKVLKYSTTSLYKNNTANFALLGYRGCNIQTYKQFFDEDTGVVFFAEIQSRRVSCWNAQKPINPDNIGVIYESDTLQFVSEIFVDVTGYLWFHSSHVPISFLTDIPFNIDHINSRTFRVKVSEAIKGTVCELSEDSGTSN